LTEIMADAFDARPREPRQLSSLFRRLFASRLFAKYRCAAKSSNPTTTISPTNATLSKSVLPRASNLSSNNAAKSDSFN
jgi:hypothetical protein